MSNSQRLNPFHHLVTLVSHLFRRTLDTLGRMFFPKVAAGVLLPDVDGSWVLAPLQGVTV